MELKCLNSMGVVWSSFARDCKDTASLRFSRKFSSRGGVTPNSGTNSVTPRCLAPQDRSVGPVIQHNIFTDSHFVNAKHGVNGLNSGLYMRDPMVLDSCEDEYGGVLVNPDRLPAKPDAFVPMLRSSLSHWRNQGKKGVWLELPLELSELVPIAVKEGFRYHHAERGYVMLTFWLPEGPCMLPGNASHQVGVGGFVVNDKNEILVVQERYCTPAVTSLWKLPTGFIQECEEIYDGAVREVKEETGIDTEFVEVIAFRHAHLVAFEKSDLFFICMLRPLSTQISVDDHEILAAKWMPLVEFFEQPLIREDRMFKKIINICLARLGRRYCGLFPHPVTSEFDGKESTLYYNILRTEDDSNCRNRGS
ncbi:hypothetical protein MLD38_010668 [Melastoma candidum]|uniref:Uncharacterized protein n=1 Tax=Melastoma candidum TaxID=119954 RepID=A0ACB9R030_9MYRT|nr:hypothetical protein MLD38_010668 [Melastoma candidum]